VKTELNDGRLRLNSAVFFTEAKNQQQGTQEFDSSGAIWFRTVNTGKSEYIGAELEVLANPVDRFQLEGSLGYIKYDRVDPGVSGLCRHTPDGNLCPAARTPSVRPMTGA
jgi:outer membrane receptor protein involved in Fe transport